MWFPGVFLVWLLALSVKMHCHCASEALTTLSVAYKRFEV